MPNNYIAEIIKSIQSGEKIKKITGFNKEEESDKNKSPPKTKKKRKIKNNIIAILTEDINTQKNIITERIDKYNFNVRKKQMKLKNKEKIKIYYQIKEVGYQRVLYKED